MNSKHVKGTVREIKGKVKQNVGHATGDSQMEKEGVVDRIKGRIEKGVGEIKDKVKEGIDAVLDKTA